MWDRTFHLQTVFAKFIGLGWDPRKRKLKVENSAVHHMSKEALRYSMRCAKRRHSSEYEVESKRELL